MEQTKKSKGFNTFYLLPGVQSYYVLLLSGQKLQLFSRKVFKITMHSYILWCNCLRINDLDNE